MGVRATEAPKQSNEVQEDESQDDLDNAAPEQDQAQDAGQGEFQAHSSKSRLDKFIEHVQSNQDFSLQNFAS